VPPVRFRLGDHPEKAVVQPWLHVLHRMATVEKVIHDSSFLGTVWMKRNS
jgi:hypothetical protein